MPAAERAGVAGDDVRVLVGLDPDAVPGAVNEQVAEAGVGDDAAGHGVHRLRAHPGGDGAHGSVLRLLEDVVLMLHRR